MKYLGLLFSIIRWLVSAVLCWIGDILAVVLAPLGCCFVYHAEEQDVTGYPSMLPGKPRAFLIWPFKWMTTQDAPVDEWWYRARYHAGTWADKYTQDDYDRSALLRWACRVAWVWRNPAYQIGAWLGFDQDGAVTLARRDEEALWKSGKPNFSYWLVRNARGAYAWWILWQWYYWGDRCLEVYIGWKLDKIEPDGRSMVAARITPFKRYAAVN